MKGLKRTQCSPIVKRRAKIHRYSFRPTWILYSSNSSRKTLPSGLMEKKEWVEKLDKEMLHKWMKLQEEMECESMVTIPRFIGNSNCQLLCFCDASTKAHVCVIYLSSDAGINLLFCKAKVASIKKLGTLRLECNGYWCPYAQLCTRTTSTPSGKQFPLVRQSRCSSLDHEQEATNNFCSESSLGDH